MRIPRVSLGVAIVVAGLFAPPAPGDDQPLSADDAARRSRILDAPQDLAEMSGAKRTALESKLGFRFDRGVAYTGEEFEDTAAAAAVSESPLGNIPVNRPAADTTAQDTQSETAVIFGDGTNVVAAFNDSGSHVGGASRFTGWALSTNGGATFTDKGTLPDNPDGDSGDPVLARSAKTKTIFLSTLSFNTGHKLLIFRSTNNGASFNLPVNGAPGFTPATGEQDKQWIAVDNTAGAGFGNVYMFWRNFAAGGGMTFTRSTNDGVTWTPNAGLKLADGGQGAQVVVGKDHAVYAFWYDSSVSPREIKMRKSTNQGTSFGSPITVAKLKGTGSNGDLGLSPGFRTSSFPQVVASPTNPGHLFAVYNDRTGTGASLDRADIYFVRSANGGTTWSAPVKNSDDPARRDQWQPALAITPDAKRLCVAFYDRRLDAANNLIDRFATIGTVSAAGTVAFGHNFRVTSQSFPPVFGVDPLVNSTYMGDYDQMTASNTHFGTTWGDNRDNSTGHAGKNANVRFAKIPVTGATEPSGGEGGNELPLEHVPEFARAAIDDAVAAAPAASLTRPVTWEQAFEMPETIAIYQFKGRDADGRPVEAETKGTRAIELEVHLPASQVPAAVRDAARRDSDTFRARKSIAVIVAGRVITYTLLGEDEGDASASGAAAATAERPSIEMNVTPEGRVSGRRRLNE